MNWILIQLVFNQISNKLKLKKHNHIITHLFLHNPKILINNNITLLVKMVISIIILMVINMLIMFHNILHNSMSFRIQHKIIKINHIIQIMCQIFNITTFQNIIKIVKIKVLIRRPHTIKSLNSKNILVSLSLNLIMVLTQISNN